MTETASDATSEKVGSAAMWILIILETAAMGAAGVSKFIATDMWTGFFTEWGYPIWFTFVVGAAETAAALLLLFPKLSSYAAMFLMVIMLVAVGTLIVNSSDMSVTTPIIHLVVLSIIAPARWGRRLR